MSELEDRVALITGGASGIGLATAERFATHGAAVVIADLASSPGEARAAELRGRGLRASFIPVDVTNEDEVRAAFAQATAEFGGVHLVVASAGVRGAEHPMTQTSIEDWRRVLSINLDGLFLTLKHGVAALVESGGGAVVVVSSIAAQGGEAGWSPYAASKAAATSLMRTAALESIKQGVRINAVSPGYVDTPMKEVFTQASAVREGFLKSLQPIGRLATAEEVAEVIHFLCSGRSAFLVGVNVPVDGGLTARATNRA
ncbi:MAG: SDR family oxidoreductase [Dehalococcoidia bacterium]|nr:SDR family oxidoreductase [Dehalococcoidia bacterium]